MGVWYAFPSYGELGITVTALLLVIVAFASPQAPKKGPQQTPFQAKPEGLQQIRAETEQLEAAVKGLKAKHPDVGDCGIPHWGDYAIVKVTQPLTCLTW
jgi:hypothetical protein